MFIYFRDQFTFFVDVKGKSAFTIRRSSGKSIATVRWNPMLQHAITYSLNANHVNAANREGSRIRPTNDSKLMKGRIQVPSLHISVGYSFSRDFQHKFRWKENMRKFFFLNSDTHEIIMKSGSECQLFFNAQYNLSFFHHYVWFMTWNNQDECDLRNNLILNFCIWISSLKLTGLYYWRRTWLPLERMQKLRNE